MSTGEHDVPDVIARPPLILFLTLIAGLVLDRMYPAAHIAQMSTGLRYLAAGCALVSGIVLLGAAANELRRAGTNIPTWEPTLALAIDGVFARSRNPIYLSFILLMIAFALIFSSAWLLVLLVPYVVVMHFGVIRREEAYLLARFGPPYADYMRRVPRYAFGI
ncbi:MAG TPA: isoprenylcysteine carboxylmethyltransferase family protein [Xanthobacteraceae bacterium]|nr:isoprenylcysteine carboxylmethyltransferase family protein [Xanthobacteraceae bacterium]